MTVKKLFPVKASKGAERSLNYFNMTDKWLRESKYLKEIFLFAPTMPLSLDAAPENH